MSKNITMPSLGADMKEGLLVNWKIKPGDTVQKGDVVAEIEADKGLFDMESYEEGVVEELITAPGETVAVGETMAVLR